MIWGLLPYLYQAFRNKRLRRYDRHARISLRRNVDENGVALARPTVQWYLKLPLILAVTLRAAAGYLQVRVCPEWPGRESGRQKNCIFHSFPLILYLETCPWRLEMAAQRRQCLA